MLLPLRPNFSLPAGRAAQRQRTTNKKTTPKLLNDETDIYFYSFDDGVRDERLGMGAGDQGDTLVWYA